MSALHRCRTGRDPSREPFAIPLPHWVEDTGARPSVGICGGSRTPHDAVRHLDKGGSNFSQIIHKVELTQHAIRFQENLIG